MRRHTAVVLISGVHRGVIPALQYALSLAPDNVSAVYVDMEPEATAKLKQKWDQWGSGIPLVVLPSPHESLSLVALEAWSARRPTRSEHVSAAWVQMGDC